jgi:hypothetical protein
MGRDYVLGAPAKPKPVPWAGVSGRIPAQGTGFGGGTAAGLSKPHIRTQDLPALSNGRLRWYPGASYVEVLGSSDKLPKKERQSKPRGRVKEFSADAMRRLKSKVAKLERDELAKALVVTLTYPGEFPDPDDFKIYKKHLHTCEMALVRKWPECSGIWKLEFQKRGAAHYHLIVCGLGDLELETVRTWFRETWYRIAHNGDKHGGIAGTQVDRIKSVGGALCYLAKYLSKGDQTRPGNFTGRYWGVHNKAALPMAIPKEIEVPCSVANKLRRIARKKIQKDVEKSRWKRFMDEKGRWSQFTRLDLERLKMAKHGGARSFKFQFMETGRMVEFEGGNYRIAGWVSVDCALSSLERHKPPKRWRARNNETVRVVCDASAFMRKLANWDKPASSYLEWSSGA